VNCGRFSSWFSGWVSGWFSGLLALGDGDLLLPCFLLLRVGGVVSGLLSDFLGVLSANGSGEEPDCVGVVGGEVAGFADQAEGSCNK